MFTVSMAFAQQKVTGVVIEAETGEPVIGASVRVKGATNIGAATNIEGKFTLEVPSSSKTLVISYIGMQTKEVVAKANMKVILESDAKALKEQFVIAYGTATKESFTGSAKVVGAETIGEAQVTSVTAALAGAVPGLQLSSSNGAPGSSPTIRIRGFSSINAGKDPLIIVDGATYSGDITNINPADVETMTVLKDAASTALYGARGANGVILINTKGSKKGQDATITVDAKYGWNTRALQNYDVISSPAQYYEMQYTALNNYYKNNNYSDHDAWLAASSAVLGKVAEGGLGYNIWTLPEGQNLFGENGRLNPLATLGRVDGDYYIAPDDWEEVGTRTGIRQEYNISATTSSDKGNAYLSVGYLDNQGITNKSDLKRFTGRFRGDYQLKKWMKVGANMTYARFDGNTLGDNGEETSTGNIWAFVTRMAPIYPAYIRNADGSIKVDSYGHQIMDYGDGENDGGQRPFIYNANPIQDVSLNTRNYEGNASSAHAYADFKFIEGLTLTVNGTCNLDETRGKTYYNPYYGQFDTAGGTLSVNHRRTYSFTTQQLINYKFTFDDVHNFAALLGHEYYKYTYKYLTAGKTSMLSDEILELGAFAIDSKSAYSYKNEYQVEGIFGRLQYDYDSKYFGTAMIRRDGSTRFHPDNCWGTFWSVGGAWLLNKESWLDDVDWLDMLKVKASYGSQGNDNIDSYLYADNYSVRRSGDGIAASFNKKGNKDITWETNNNYNFGVEFGLWGNKLSGGLEYYYRKTTDMLFSFTVPSSLGYSSVYKNVGDMYNTGLELDLNYNVIQNNKVQWDVRFNIASLKNKITKLHDDVKTAKFYDLDGNVYQGYTSGSFFRHEGSTVYSWRLKEFAGVYNKETYAMTGDKEYDPSKGGLSMWYKRTAVLGEDGKAVKDANGNEVMTNVATTSWSDATYYVNNESTVPKFYGGFGTSVKFYGFDLSVNCSFSIGGKGFDSTYQDFMASPTNSSAGFNFHKDLLKSWSPDNEYSDIPRFQYDDLESVSSSTRFLTNASYLNIENINIGYTLPKHLLSAAQIQSLRVYCAAENVCYFSARKGFDPRQTYSGSTNATRYSPIRSISVGATLTF